MLLLTVMFRSIVLVVLLVGCGLVQPTKRCVNLNTSSPEELTRIVHITPEMAEDVVSQRPFYRVEHLVLVPGVWVQEMEEILEQGLACI